MNDRTIEREELAYFEYTVKTIESQLTKLVKAYTDAESDLQKYLASSWEDGTHMGASIDRLIEAVQIGKMVKTHEAIADKRLTAIKDLRSLSASPYFARVDFIENGTDATEKLYIGRHSLFDDDSGDLVVYDWRAPMSSIFYRFERGDVFFDSPGGRIEGEVTLKRQYEIKNGKFEYCFDADIRISDDFLRRMLSRNASEKMKTIVETIQKEQDVIIRDGENELLTVQGVAGSGKTSIALHRVAYLMYEGLSSRLDANDIVIISPNMVFESYISGVLPELGESNITTLEFDGLAADVTKGFAGAAVTRNEFLERLIAERDPEKRARLKREIRFKTSEGFVSMLEKWRDRAMREFDFHDVTWGGTVVRASELTGYLTRREDRNSSESRVMRARESVYRALREAQKARHRELFSEYDPEKMKPSDIAIASRVRSLRECRAIVTDVEEMTALDYPALYKRLVSDAELMAQLLPKRSGISIDELREIAMDERKRNVGEGLSHADLLAFAYFVLLFRQDARFRGIKQVVVDEAQDYYPIQYEMLKKLFPKARYTILGDVNQTIGKNEDESVYDMIERVLAKKKSIRMTMRKSFRCTNQIIAFSANFIDERFGLVSFNRDGREPEIVKAFGEAELICRINEIADGMISRGCGSVAVITKSSSDAEAVYSKLGRSDSQLISGDDECRLTGTLVLPIYLAKGLEFDGVIIYDASDKRYIDEDDKRLLYIESTRALHELAVTYDTKPSKFLPGGESDV